MLARLAACLVDQRRWVLLLVAAATIVAAQAATRLRFDFTPQALFAGKGDLLAYSQQVSATFGHAENMVLVVQEAVGPDDLLTPAALRWHADLCQRLAALPTIERIDALGTLRMPRLRLLSSSLVYIPIVRDRPIDDDEAALIRRKVADQPLLDGVLISRDRRVGAIAVHLDPARKDIEHLQKAIRQIRGVLRDATPPAGFRDFIGGLPAMRVSIVDGLRSDQATIIPICTVLFALMQVLVFRSWMAVFVSGCAVVTGLFWTLGALAALDQSITIISNVLPVLLMIIGMSSCVHFLNGYAEHLQQRPGDRRLAILETVTHLTSACFLTSVTTALGFLSLLAARSDLLGAMGWQAALGILLFFVATVVVCSTMLPLYRPRVLPLDKNGEPASSPLARLAWGAGAWAMQHPRRVCGGALLVMIAAAALGTQTTVNSQLTETFDPDHPEVAHMRIIEDQLGGFVPMEIVLTSSQPRWYLTADAWRKMVELQDFVDGQAGVLQTRSPVDLFAEIDRRLPGEPLSSASTDDGAGLEARLRTIQRLQNRYAAQGAVRRFATANGKQIRLLIRIRDSGTNFNLRLASSLQQKLSELFPESGPVRPRLTGDAYVAAVALNGFIYDLLYSLLGVTALIFVVMGILLKSPRLGIISVAPNVAPLVVTLGYLNLRGYALNMGNVIVFAISLGVAVDDTIHFLARFRKEDRSGRSLREAVRRTCLGTGRAVLVTTILIVAGLAILLLSNFVPTRRFAELATVTMISALLGDLLILPALLQLFWPQAEKSP